MPHKSAMSKIDNKWDEVWFLLVELAKMCNYLFKMVVNQFVKSQEKGRCVYMDVQFLLAICTVNQPVHREYTDGTFILVWSQ